MTTIATIRVRTAARPRTLGPTALLTRRGPEMLRGPGTFRNRTVVLSSRISQAPLEIGSRDPDVVRRAPLPHATSRSSMAPRRPMSWSSGPSSSAWPGSRSPTTRACTGSSGSQRPPRRPVSGRSSASEIELLDAAVADPARSSSRPGGRPGDAAARPAAGQGAPAHRLGRARPVEAARLGPRPDRARLPGHRAVGQGGPARDRRARSAAPISCCWRATRSGTGASAGWSRGPTWPARKGCRVSARRSSRSTPRGSSPCPAAATARSHGGSGSATGRRPRRRRVRDDLRLAVGDGIRSRSGFFIELAHHLLPDDDWLVAEIGRAGRRSSVCPSWSPTMSTTPGPRTASSRTS